jgi:hypothetical protein
VLKGRILLLPVRETIALGVCFACLFVFLRCGELSDPKVSVLPVCCYSRSSFPACWSADISLWISSKAPGFQLNPIASCEFHFFPWSFGLAGTMCELQLDMRTKCAFFLLQKDWSAFEVSRESRDQLSIGK